MAHPHWIRQLGGFPFGFTAVTRAGEPMADTGIDFGILKLRAGEVYSSWSDGEEVLLLLSGAVVFEQGMEVHRAQRRSFFDDPPTAYHRPARVEVLVKAQTDCELIVAGTANPREFPAEFFDAGNMLENEHRDKGKLDDTSYRIVRTIFDLRNRPESNLVLGEVVNFPGRWSSYPPHHHMQPEIYHYRFSHPNGFGHCELGEDVLKVRPFDTVKILDMNDHSQVAAPGYGMFYVWVIRHLPNDPYKAPEFARDHAWLRHSPPHGKKSAIDPSTRAGSLGTGNQETKIGQETR